MVATTIATTKLQVEWCKAWQRKGDFFATRKLEVIVILDELIEEGASKIAAHVEATTTFAGDKARPEDGSHDISEVIKYQHAYSKASPE